LLFNNSPAAAAAAAAAPAPAEDRGNFANNTHQQELKHNHWQAGHLRLWHVFCVVMNGPMSMLV
jgi:hypothetical protein